ncbi:MAG TPA: hypothetical protein VN920_05140 [Pyrinomonadaceae bacterium]|nr:hypothetical protein [Pyrinomonadaceae bacterium]
MLSGKPGALFELFVLNWLADNVVFGDDAATPYRHSRLGEDLGMDGLDFYGLLLAIDDRFGFERHDPAFEDNAPVTVDDVVNYHR